MDLKVEDLYLASEAPKNLGLEIRNSLRGSAESDAELKNSIRNQGIIHPLIWKEVNGKKYVIAGNRRLRLLRDLEKETGGHIAVPTRNVTDYGDNWIDVAMDTNLALPPHPVERYETIVRVAKTEKLRLEEACERYGMTDAQYRRVAALGKMSPVIRQAWKDGKLTRQGAQAFTLEPDPDEQEKIFNSLNKQLDEDDRMDDYSVLARVEPKSQQDARRFIAFLGADEIRKAKLLKQEDLFGGRHFVTDVKAIKKLAAQKLQEVVDKLIAEGWSWAMTDEDLKSSPNPHQYQYGHSQAKNGKFTPEQMKRGGCIVSLNYNGGLDVSYGRLKPADKAKAAAAERRAAKPSGAVPEKRGLSIALQLKLVDQMEQAIGSVLAKNHHVAVAAIIAGFASSGHIISVEVGTDGKDLYGDAAAKQFIQIFKGAVIASSESLDMMLAKVASEAISISNNGMPAKNAALMALTEALPVDALQKALIGHFNAAEYFAGVDMGTIVAAVKCAMGSEFAADVAKMKKSDAVKFVAENLPTTYLPEQLRTTSYEGPTEKVEKPKAAPKAAKRKAKK